MQAETPLLLSQGVSNPAIYSMLDELQTKLKNSEASATAQFEQTFGAVDRDHDKKITLDEWKEWNSCLPACYDDMLRMFGSIIRSITAHCCSLVLVALLITDLACDMC